VISEKARGISWEEKKFCCSCALANLAELEESDYKIEDKKSVPKEIRTALLTVPTGDQEELLEPYRK
jgi:hypothetical protein